MSSSRDRVLNAAAFGLPLLVTLVFIGWTRLSDRTDDAVHLTLEAGDALPDVSVTAADGRRMPLRDAVGTGPWLMLIVSETCPHCETQVAAVEAMAAQTDRIGGLDVLILSVGGDRGEPLWDPQQSSFPTYDDSDGELVDALELDVVPVSLFGDGDATVRRIEIGWTSAEHMRGAAESFLDRAGRGAE